MPSEDQIVLVGVACPFGVLSADLGGFKELVLPGAFDATLNSAADVWLDFEHDRNRLLARRSNGSLRLFATTRGLAFEADLLDTTLAADARKEIEAGLRIGVSIMFRHGPKERWREGRPSVRELISVELRAITLTGFPAYDGTSVLVRTKMAMLRSQHDLRRRRVELVGRELELAKQKGLLV